MKLSTVLTSAVISATLISAPLSASVSGIGTATHAEKVCQPTNSPYFYRCGIELNGVLSHPIIVNVPNKQDVPLYPSITRADRNAHYTAAPYEGASGRHVWVGTRMGNHTGRSYFTTTRHGQTAVHYVSRARAVKILNSGCI